MLRTVNHLNDLHGSHAAEFVEQGGFRAGPQIVGKSLPKHVDAVAQIVQLPQCVRTRPRSAGIADVLVPLGNLVQIPRQGADTDTPWQRHPSPWTWVIAARLRLK